VSWSVIFWNALIRRSISRSSSIILFDIAKASREKQQSQIGKSMQYLTYYGNMENQQKANPCRPAAEPAEAAPAIRLRAKLKPGHSPPSRRSPATEVALLSAAYLRHSAIRPRPLGNIPNVVALRRSATNITRNIQFVSPLGWRLETPLSALGNPAAAFALLRGGRSICEAPWTRACS
jgi:hypothetical protein